MFHCLNVDDHESCVCIDNKIMLGNYNHYKTLCFFKHIINIESQYIEYKTFTLCKHSHGLLARYVKLRVAHALGIPGTFSPATDFKGNR